MKISKAISTLERRRDWLINKAQSAGAGPSGLYIQEGCAIQLAIEILQEKQVDLAMIGGSMEFKYFHQGLEDLKQKQSSDYRAFLKMESNTI